MFRREFSEISRNFRRADVETLTPEKLLELSLTVEAPKKGDVIIVSNLVQPEHLDTFAISVRGTATK